MTNRFAAWFFAFALVALSALTQILFAQDGKQRGGKQKQAEKDSPTKNLPFDPHDISGIWRNPGGFDPVLGNDRPPMTDWGNSSNGTTYGVIFGRTGASSPVLTQSRGGTDMRLRIGMETPLWLNP